MKVIPFTGWVLVGREEDLKTGVKRKTGPFYVARDELFTRKRDAVRFMRDHNWGPGYRAIRGKIVALTTSQRAEK